nr:hypothetical protein [uncultured Actinotalea sp.]
MTAPSFHTDVVLHQVLNERGRQFARHGDQSHVPDGTGPTVRPLAALIGNGQVTPLDARWLAKRAAAHTDTVFNAGHGTFRDILLEEVFEALAEDDPARLRAELLQIAAVAVQWVETIDARTGGAR